MRRRADPGFFELAHCASDSASDPKVMRATFKAARRGRSMSGSDRPVSFGQVGRVVGRMVGRMSVRQDAIPDRKEMTDTAAHHEQMPDGMVEWNSFPQIEPNTD